MFFIQWVLMIMAFPLKGWLKKPSAKKQGHMRRKMGAALSSKNAKKLLMGQKLSLKTSSTPSPFRWIGSKNIKPFRQNRKKFHKQASLICLIKIWWKEDSPPCFGIAWIEQPCRRQIWLTAKCQAQCIILCSQFVILNEVKDLMSWFTVRLTRSFATLRMTILLPSPQQGQSFCLLALLLWFTLKMSDIGIYSRILMTLVRKVSLALMPSPLYLALKFELLLMIWCRWTKERARLCVAPLVMKQTSNGGRNMKKLVNCQSHVLSQKMAQCLDVLLVMI